MIAHGGDLLSACQQHGGQPHEWLDLSTGISPYAYPLGDIPKRCWQQLPYPDPGFLAAASEYYLGNGPDRLEWLACAGSQAVISLLPQLLPKQPILLPELGYQEHQLAWQLAGADTHHYPSWELAASAQAIEQALERNPQQHLLLIQPNNPTGLLFTQTQLLAWAQKLDGLLIVDEAFIDQQPEASLLHGACLPDNLVLLRSFGKFFGLAGLRLAFLFGPSWLVSALAQRLGPWQVSGPAQYVATQALADRDWQAKQRQRHLTAMQAQQGLLAPFLLGWQASWQQQTPLFSSWLMRQQCAQKLAEQAVKQRLLLRYLNSPRGTLVRVGLAADLPRFATALPLLNHAISKA